MGSEMCIRDRLKVKIKIGGMWHAGSYDPADFLGRLIGAAPWVRYAEASMFECYDHNYFATRFHVDLFATCFLNTTDDIEKNLDSSFIDNFSCYVV